MNPGSKNTNISKNVENEDIVEMSDWETVLAQAENLEKISDANLIHYFAQELSLIGEGQRAKTLLPNSVIQNFMRLDLLEKKYENGMYVLTEKAREIL